MLGSNNLSGVGNALANRIVGNLGNNLLEGMGGSDTLVGGYGTDMASYEHSTLGVVADLGTGTALVGSEQDTLFQIEHLTGSALRDILTGDAGDNRLLGLGGNDLIDGADAFDTLDMSRAASSVTVLLNQFYGGGTSTSANGAEGSDVLIDFEKVIGSRFGDVILDANYRNELHNLFKGGAGNDSLSGGYGSDTLIGGSGNDTLGGATAYSSYYHDIDVLDYSGATSAVRGNLSGVVASTGLGRDTVINFEHVIASDFNDSLIGAALNEWMEGGAGLDVLRGGAGNDTLDGGAGEDQLFGGSNNDTLNGVAGNDALDGGYGFDAISYASLSLTGIDADLSTGIILGDDTDTILNLSIKSITGTAKADVIAWKSTITSTYIGFSLYGGRAMTV